MTYVLAAENDGATGGSGFLPPPREPHAAYGTHRAYGVAPIGIDDGMMVLSAASESLIVGRNHSIALLNEMSDGEQAEVGARGTPTRKYSLSSWAGSSIWDEPQF